MRASWNSRRACSSRLQSQRTTRRTPLVSTAFQPVSSQISHAMRRLDCNTADGPRFWFFHLKVEATKASLRIFHLIVEATGALDEKLRGFRLQAEGPLDRLTVSVSLSLSVGVAS